MALTLQRLAAGAGLAAVVGAGAIWYGCSDRESRTHPKAAQLAQATNTLPITPGNSQYKTPAYSIDEVVDDRVYMAVPLPAGKTARIDDKVIAPSNILPVMLIPYENSKETIVGGKVTVEPIDGDVYFMANVRNSEGHFVLNKKAGIARSRAIFDINPLEEKLTTSSAYTQTRKIEEATRNIPEVTINGMPFYSAQTLTRKRVFVKKDGSAPVIQTTRERLHLSTSFTETGINGDIYMVFAGDLANIEQEKPKQPEDKIKVKRSEDSN